MTTNATVLRDVLSRRIARGMARPSDLPLLDQLLRCQKNRCVLLGAAAGWLSSCVAVGLVHLLS